MDNSLSLLDQFNDNDFIEIGSSYFFKNYPDFNPHDFDFGKFVEKVPFYENTCHTIKKGNCYFLWRKKSPEEFVEDLLLTKNTYAAGKFLIPEICDQIGFKIKHLKQLSPLFDNLNELHSYQKIIYDAYIENNSFTLTKNQLDNAYESYKKIREDNKYYKYIYFMIYPEKFKGVLNKFHRLRGYIAIYLATDREKPFIIETFNSLKKIYPNLVAYESLNYYEFKDINSPNDFLKIPNPSKPIGNYVSVDVDSINIDWNIFSKYLRKSFIENNIHCDFQKSPHGCHLIINRENIKSVCKILKNINKKLFIKDKSKGCILKKDIISNTKLLDGIDIDGFKVKTTKDWS